MGISLKLIKTNLLVESKLSLSLSKASNPNTSLNHKGINLNHRFSLAKTINGKAQLTTPITINLKLKNQCKSKWKGLNANRINLYSIPSDLRTSEFCVYSDSPLES
jgi:hypothetical protein